jgi:plasmid stabilization system protein ParE
MGIEIKWSELASAQIENIYEYYKEIASHIIARKLVKGIIETSQLLKGNPLLGAIEPLLVDREFEYRFLIEKNYKIIYHLDGRLVRIAAIIDCRQNPKKIQKAL